jgi:hypothetical protein
MTEPGCEEVIMYRSNSSIENTPDVNQCQSKRTGVYNLVNWLEPIMKSETVSHIVSMSWTTLMMQKAYEEGESQKVSKAWAMEVG